MPKGYTTPRTPLGRSILVQPPPWHYVGTALAVEYDARPEAVAALLPSIPISNYRRLRPSRPSAGYRFDIALTLDDLVTVSDLRG